MDARGISAIEGTGGVDDVAPGMITGLRFYGAPCGPVTLAEETRIFTIGAGACDLVIPPELARDVAPVHATIERVEGAIRIRDQLSRHGLYRTPRAPRVVELLLHPGAVGWVGGCAILAVDHGLEALRTRLAWSMGLDAHAVVDGAVAAVGDGVPLALLGPAGLDAAALARAIHDAGADRGRPFVTCDGAETPSLDSFAGTVAIDLDRTRKLAASCVAALFASHCPARVIFLANDERVLRRHLDVYTERVRALMLTPLNRRPHEVTRLLQTIWSDELRSERLVADVDPRALDGMAAQRWRYNFDDLRAAAPRLLAYLEQPSLRRAAQALGVRHQTLAQHLHRMGVPILDQADRELLLRR